MSDVIVSYEKLKAFVVNKFIDVGVAESDASTVADVLVHADLRGVHSHGVLRTEHYVNRIKAGGVNIYPCFEKELTGASTAKINGDNGLGHIVANASMETAIELALQTGVGAVVSYNSSHCGALSYFVKQAAEKNLIGMAMTQADKMVVPFGGKEKFFGTNPIAYGIPAKQYKPVILDMATSSVAFGKVLQAREIGARIPERWGVDKNGKPTTNPHEAEALLPMAGAKGYGLGMVVDVFSGLLAGMAFGPHIKPMYEQLNELRKLGHFFMVINPSSFTDKEYFLQSMDQMINELHEMSPIEGYEKVMVPGEPEQLKEETRLKEGIPIAESIYKYLTENS
ncbi:MULTISPECIES: ureidoglycolate dehydrogenase [Clostridia]|uniref:ureidoglycolate dehydrogenase n=1 Tax=Clostridia TaxID=186801 RepID=UPI000EA1A7FB|nr:MULTISPECIES: ureidoglycolate dehydrogenase [Clostridia]NBJ71610.1 ureidoglycolate dehydrogenase [Roseburia sp. 1XD42-34]RKI76844.1 ureidoglycolate dehydrogenase [Clostridium sp. 1xD42-85]